MLRNDPHIGSPRNRVDGPAKVTGAATYAAEFAAEHLGYGYIVESSTARGRIRSIDVSAAEAAPGVIKIFTHENRPQTAWFTYKYRDQVGPPGSPFRPLYSDEIQYSGQPIALVVATSFDAAREAAALVSVSYEEEPHMTDLSIARSDAYEPKSAWASPLRPIRAGMPSKRSARLRSASVRSTPSRPSTTIRWSRTRRL